jgi:hypothetical protein
VSDAPEFVPVPGETVLWTGHPDPAVIFAPSDVWLVPLSLFWGGFVAFWEASVAKAGAPIFFLVFGGAFALFGAYFVIGRFFYKAWRKRRTTYALTAGRVVAVMPNRSRELRLPVPGLSETRHSDARHMSVVFEAPARQPSIWRRSMAASMYRNSGMEFWGDDGSIGFYDVDDVDGLSAALARIRVGKEHA